MTGKDADGIAETEADHLMQCPGCGQWFDMRNLSEVIEHGPQPGRRNHRR
jgi:hypothetical protein